MTDPGRIATRCRRPCLALAALVVSAWGPVKDLPPPTLQEMVVGGHVLNFQEHPIAGDVVIALVYATSDSKSHDEAAALAALLGDGLAVGGLVMRPRLVEQAKLMETSGYAAVFATTGVDETVLAAVLKQRHIPCLTRHLEQVEHGACTVAIRSDPDVSIVVNQANAANAGVHFATAFRMMVREI